VRDWKTRTRRSFSAEIRLAVTFATHPEAKRMRALAMSILSVIAATPTASRVRPHVSAAIEREVRLRDGNRCQFPLDAGGVCGSTWQVELDHVVPLALGGETSAANLRCACRRHNQLAAAEALGDRAVRPSLRGQWRLT